MKNNKRKKNKKPASNEQTDFINCLEEGIRVEESVTTETTTEKQEDESKDTEYVEVSDAKEMEVSDESKTVDPVSEEVEADAKPRPSILESGRNALSHGLSSRSLGLPAGAKLMQKPGRTIVIGDIHSSYKALVQLFAKVKPKQEDTFIFLGDYVDGWADCVRTLKWLIMFKKTFRNSIFLLGNHDEWLLDFAFDRTAKASWLKNGGTTTKYALEQEFLRNPLFADEIISFVRGCHDYYIDDENRAFIHAGWNDQRGISREYDSRNAFLWNRTLWYNHIDEKKKEVKYFGDKDPRLNKYKEVFIGHTTTLTAGVMHPVRVHNLINMDTGAGGGGKLSAMNVVTKTTWQSDPVAQLYPDDPHANWKPQEKAPG
jgi:serine/threonine protein phosphatase 1